MGLGIGVHCDTCGDQLSYDKDGEEIAFYIKLDDEGKQIINHKPVLCHECVEVIRSLKKLTSLPVIPGE